MKRTQQIEITCPLCQQPYTIPTGLQTSKNNLRLGYYQVFLCLGCHNAFTFPSGGEDNSLLPIDLPRSCYPRGIQIALRYFVLEKLRIVAKVIGSNHYSGLKILDVGGGSCQFANELAIKGAVVTVVEPNIKNKRFALPKVTFINSLFDQTTIDKYKLNRNSFDAITFWHVLEHCSNPAEICQLAGKLLKRGGALIIAVPNITSFQALVGMNHWSYLDIPHHRYHFSPKGLEALVTQNALRRTVNVNFSPEYDIFGWQQTLLNVLTNSHNYFYDKVKKSRNIDKLLRFPRLVKALTAIQFVLLPFSIILTLLSALADHSSCLIYGFKKIESD